MWNVAQPATSAQVIGQHDAPIRVVKYLDQNNVVVTGSWDKTVKVWDCRQPNPVAQTTFNERVHCMDANNQAMVRVELCTIFLCTIYIYCSDCLFYDYLFIL